MDIASETPTLRSVFPSLPNSSACRGSLAHHPIFLSGILLCQAVPLLLQGSPAPHPEEEG